MRAAYFSLGSNLGDRATYLRDAVQVVADNDPYRLSSIYETESVGGVDQAVFWNAVLEVVTAASPLELLARAHRAEVAAQRTRDVRWGPRTLDVDVLLVGDESWNDAALTVPHPRMWERRFVLVPLAELAPTLVAEDVVAAATGAVHRLGTLDTLR